MKVVLARTYNQDKEKKEERRFGCIGELAEVVNFSIDKSIQIVSFLGRERACCGAPVEFGPLSEHAERDSLRVMLMIIIACY
jgi:hypothetical protein